MRKHKGGGQAVQKLIRGKAVRLDQLDILSRKIVSFIEDLLRNKNISIIIKQCRGYQRTLNGSGSSECMGDHGREDRDADRVLVYKISRTADILREIQFVIQGTVITDDGFYEKIERLWRLFVL